MNCGVHAQLGCTVSSTAQAASKSVCAESLTGAVSQHQRFDTVTSSHLQSCACVQVMRSAASPLHRVRLGKDELAVVVDPATGQLLKCAAAACLMMKAHSQQAPEAC